jgi:hypothetical protein
MESDRIYEDIQAQGDNLRLMIGHFYGAEKQRLKQAAQFLCNEKPIVFIGMGSATYLNYPAKFYLGRYGRYADVINASDALYSVLVKNRKSARALPNTFVPGRNIIFLAFAAALAYREGIHHLVAGVCEADYSGYPDCRDRAIRSLQKTLELGMDYGIRIHTPLIYMTKARALRLAKRLGAYEALAHSHTCYNNRRPPCGKCQACRLRAKAFRQAGMRDPLTRTTSARNIPKPAEARCTAPGNRRPIPGSP